LGSSTRDNVCGNVGARFDLDAELLRLLDQMLHFVTGRTLKLSLAKGLAEPIFSSDADDASGSSATRSAAATCGVSVVPLSVVPPALRRMMRLIPDLDCPRYSPLMVHIRGVAAVLQIPNEPRMVIAWRSAGSFEPNDAPG
jgi:DNA-binding transcriptional LysR family regulator